MVADALLAAALGTVVLVGSAEAAAGQVPPRRALDGAAFWLIGVAVASVAVRRTRPLVGLATASASVTAYLAMGYPYGPVLFVLPVGLFTVAALLPGRRSLVAAGAALSAVVTGALASVAASPSSTGWWLVAASGWTAVPWAAGLVVRSRRQAVDAAQEEAVRRRAYEERLGTAQEVHDVVGHALAVISIQAGVALHVVSRRPEQASVALEAIRRTSKSALDELRVTLAVLRGTGDGDELARPAPGLAGLTELVQSVRDAGLRVHVTVRGTPVPLTAEADRAAYRIVQEALTNVLRHAGATATAWVVVTWKAEAVEVDVDDDGVDGAGSRPGNGQGIAGMRERATEVGGILAAGPRPGGGFTVRACLPTGGDAS